MATPDENYRRGYIQSWNFMLEKALGNWSERVPTWRRAPRQSSRIEDNWGTLACATPVACCDGATRERRPRFSGAPTARRCMTPCRSSWCRVAITVTHSTWPNKWAHGRGYTSESATAQQRVKHPQHYWKNRAPVNNDIRHNLVISNVYELPVGRGMSFAQSGVPAVLLG